MLHSSTGHRLPQAQSAQQCPADMGTTALMLRLMAELLAPAAVIPTRGAKWQLLLPALMPIKVLHRVCSVTQRFSLMQASHLTTYSAVGFH